MKFQSDAGRLHHRAALLQAAEQHRRARRPPVDAPAARSSPRSRSPNETASGWQEQALAAAGPDHRRARPTSSPTTRRRAASASAPATSPRRVGHAARCTRARRRQRRLQLRRHAAFPTESWNSTNYWVDADLRAHAARRHARAAGRRRHARPTARPASPAATTRRPSTFDEAMTPATRHRARRSRCQTSSARPSPRPVAYDAADADGDAHAVGAARARRAPTRSPSTAAPAASRTSPATRWPPTRTWSFSTPARVPVHASSTPTEGPLGDALSDSPLEVGMKIRSTEDGCITRAALLQAAQQHRHATSATCGRRDGQQLAEVTFTNETASGWQQEELPQPVPITAGHDATSRPTTPPTAASRFSPGYFAGARRPHPAGRAQRPRRGGNGVYKYGAERLPGRDASARTNYWVDATFERTQPADTRPPRHRALEPRRRAPSASPLDTHGEGHVRRADGPR